MFSNKHLAYLAIIEGLTGLSCCMALLTNKNKEIVLVLALAIEGVYCAIHSIFLLFTCETGSQVAFVHHMFTLIGIYATKPAKVPIYNMLIILTLINISGCLIAGGNLMKRMRLIDRKSFYNFAWVIGIAFRFVSQFSS